MDAILAKPTPTLEPDLLDHFTLIISSASSHMISM
jgi:hypothetical protein